MTYHAKDREWWILLHHHLHASYRTADVVWGTSAGLSSHLLFTILRILLLLHTLLTGLLSPESHIQNLTHTKLETRKCKSIESNKLWPYTFVADLCCTFVALNKNRPFVDTFYQPYEASTELFFFKQKILVCLIYQPLVADTNIMINCIILYHNMGKVSYPFGNHSQSYNTKKDRLIAVKQWSIS